MLGLVSPGKIGLSLSYCDFRFLSKFWYSGDAGETGDLIFG